MAGNRNGAMKTAARRAGVSLDEYRERIGKGQKRCTRCKTWHERAAFGADVSRPDGLSSTCLFGRKDHYQVSYAPVVRVRQQGRQYVPGRSGDRIQARARANRAVTIGTLPHPNDVPCVDCGHVWEIGERRHEYDHHLGYAAEHHLSVQSVCTTCHHARSQARGEAPVARPRVAGRYTPEPREFPR